MDGPNQNKPVVVKKTKPVKNDSIPARFKNVTAPAPLPSVSYEDEPLGVKEAGEPLAGSSPVIPVPAAVPGDSI